MITLIGTIHVIDLSNQLIKTFDEIEPDLICIESGEKRYEIGLLMENNPIQFKKEISSNKILFSMIQIQKFEKTLAKKNKTKLGGEFSTAIKYAETHNILCEHIDMDLEELIKLWKSKSIFVRFLFTCFLFKFRIISYFLPRFVINKIIKCVMNSKESTGRMIVSRNKHMVTELKKLNLKYDNIIAVVGNRHINGMSRLLEKEKIDFRFIRTGNLIQN